MAGVEAGALVHFEEPNYALLAEATGTIQSLLNRLVSHEITKQPLELPNGNSNASAPSPADDPGQIDWEPWDTRGFQDFEQGFWLNLAEHPFLSGMENEGSHFS